MIYSVDPAMTFLGELGHFLVREAGEWFVYPLIAMPLLYGVTGLLVGLYIFRNSDLLSTPLPGSRACPEAPDGRLAVPKLSTPLPGSPSPIPGFSGSPRRSAAVPLCTAVIFGHYLDISFRPFIRV
jgi:hypothetical protein